MRNWDIKDLIKIKYGSVAVAGAMIGDIQGQVKECLKSIGTISTPQNGIIKCDIIIENSSKSILSYKFKGDNKQWLYNIDIITSYTKYPQETIEQLDSFVKSNFNERYWFIAEHDNVGIDNYRICYYNYICQFLVELHCFSNNDYRLSLNILQYEREEDYPLFERSIYETISSLIREKENMKEEISKIIDNSA